METPSARQILDEGGGVWVPRAYIGVCGGDITAALVLSQILYRSGGRTVSRNGFEWVVQSYDEWDAEVGVCERTMRRKLGKLADLGLIVTETHLIGPETTRLFIRVDQAAVDAALLSIPGPDRLADPGPDRMAGPIGPDRMADPSYQQIETRDEPTLVNFVDGSEEVIGSSLVPHQQSVEETRARETKTVDVVDGPTAIGRRLLAAWIEAVGKNPERVKLNEKRMEKIRARLNEGYTEADLTAAVRGIALSPFHMGDNEQRKEFNDLHVALRDGEQVEKFRDLWESGALQRRRSGVETVMGALSSAGIDDNTELSGFRFDS